ncbi:hypothetical protein ACFCV8_09425 [Streptomyces sp. NPDC056347]|uniref:hypothetical protein n=1 Tax=Streptomyces sp. NPDC056347 TaxID=3345790 RepID=UPI0035DE166C
MDDPRLRTLRPSSLEVRRVVGRPDLPDLLRTRDARSRLLPRLTIRPTFAGPGRRWHTDLP